MLFHDRVNLWTCTIEIDGMGNDVLVWHDQGNVPAAVFPLDTDHGDGTQVTTRYRVVLAPKVPIAVPTPEFGVRVGWGPYPATIQPNSGLILDGGIERHYHRGRLHHYEFITKNIVGG